MVRRCAHRIRGSRGLGGPCLHRFALTHRLFFFGPELGLYQHSLASQRSILEHVSICSPSQFVHLHEKPYRLFFERELDGTAPISVRVIATIGITHGRKAVLPSRNPCDSDGTASISVRVIATIGITNGRKTGSPSRNPCDSYPFLVALTIEHQRC